MLQEFKPGLHIIAKLTNCAANTLINYEGLKQVIDQAIKDHALINLGEVYHKFEQGGFTAVVCLSESHLSVHTWPEFGLVNFDIYLSNYMRNNENVVRAIFEDFTKYFGGTVLEQQNIQR